MEKATPVYSDSQKVAIVISKLAIIEIGSVHPSESGTIAVFRGEKGESQLGEKGNIFNSCVRLSKKFNTLTPNVRKCWVPRYWSFVFTTVFCVQRLICHEVNTSVNYFNRPQE